MKLKTLSEIPPWDWPDGTDEMLLEILSGREVAYTERLLAAEMAGDYAVINDKLAEALLSILRSGDEAEELRATAAIALGPALEQADMDGFEDPDDVPISEGKFDEIRELLRRFYLDANVPKDVRRRILEASVRAPQDWHQGAVRAAYADTDRDWKLTAVFCMQFIRGFDGQILETIESEDQEIRREAILAAGNWELEAAWPQVAALLTAEDTDKPLLLAAIEAAGSIRPQEAAELFTDLLDSDDEDIVEAVQDAMVMSADEWDDEDEEF